MCMPTQEIQASCSSAREDENIASLQDSESRIDLAVKKLESTRQCHCWWSAEASTVDVFILSPSELSNSDAGCSS